MNNPNFNRKFQGGRQEDSHRVNFQIKVPQVRVVRDEEQLGVMSTDQARKMASDDGLDLVEIVPNSKPPVCKIMDYGRFKYEQKLKVKESAKRQRETQIQLKEIRLRPKSGMMVPVQLGFRKYWQKQARKLLLNKNGEIANYINQDIIRNWLDFQGDTWGRYGVKLWLLVSLEIWLQVNKSQR